MSATPSNEQILLSEALKIEETHARAEFLERACRGDQTLHRRLEVLIRASRQVGQALGRTPSCASQPRQPWLEPPDESAGDHIGPYKLLQLIGEGGFGSVWMAEQDSPIRRRVALKIIKQGMDTKEFIGRFEQERQALALMEHPNIARVFDAGATPKGRPFFVMELVRGVPLTNYCDEHNLTLRERLHLFIQVCHAVHHAHQKGVIHRDLKPANVLVTVNDGVPIAKVIDFGVAKAIHARLTDKTFFTQFERMIGTPRYMSPEQAEMTSVDVDTRSDLYSLGVILYELLTGLTPLDSATLARAGIDEIRHLIREVDALRPSQRVQTLSPAAVTTTASRRRTESRQLPSQLRGDLDWIVMKCLEKDRQRRYDSPKALADDLAQHLGNGVVTARPPTLAYLATRLIRRHKLAFATGAILVLFLVGGLAATNILLVSERAARRRAVAAEVEQSRLRKSAEAASAEAVASEQKARHEAAKSAEVADFLTDMIKGAGPSIALGRDTTLLREILEKTTGRIEKEFQHQPALQADLNAVLADVYQDLGLYPQSEARLRTTIALREKLFAPDSPELGNAFSALGTALEMQGQLADSELAFRRALAVRQKAHGPRHAAVTHATTKLAHLLRDQHKDAEAKALFAEAYAARETLFDKPTEARAESIHNLAVLASKLGRYPDAESLLQQALHIRRQLFASDHPEIAASLSSLAFVFHMQHRLPEAEKFGRETLAMERRLLGNEHPGVALTLNNLGVVLHDQRKFSEAEAMLREAVAIREKRLGTNHPWTTGSLSLLAHNLSTQGRHTEAEQLLRARLAATGKAALSDDDKILFHHRLGANLFTQKRFEESETLFLTNYEAIIRARESAPAAHLERLRENLGSLVALYQASGDTAKTGEWQQQLADLNAAHPPPISGK